MMEAASERQLQAQSNQAITDSKRRFSCKLPQHRQFEISKSKRNGHKEVEHAASMAE